MLYRDAGRAAEPAIIDRMLSAIRHRGPDDSGVWAQGPIALGSRRLAVIDLSARGHQPMANEDGSIHIVFNGEIYNFMTLRQELLARGHTFTSDTDTETIVHLYEERGPDCVRALRGMFAFALWDQRRRRLLLARDRLGKKPLFYTVRPEGVWFASEPKAILQDSRVPAVADPGALHDFLTFGYVPTPQSAFAGMRKLPPAHYALVQDGDVSLTRYWALSYLPKRREPEHNLIEEFDALLENAVRLRLIADVPVGALLSGGLDSSTVVAMVRRVHSGRVRTFSIGFDQADYDERRYAREVAQRFETEHHELQVKADAAALLPRLAWFYDEPFGDSSALPSFMVAQMTRELVTVALNGDGGDEAFLGYDRYRAFGLAATLDVLPASFRRRLAGTVMAAVQDGGAKSASRRLRRFAAGVAASGSRRYARWVTVLDDAAKHQLYTGDFARLLDRDALKVLDAAFEDSDATTPAERASHADVRLYLPDDLLVKMDIASMAHSLEMRSPFLDHAVLEFAARLPSRLKLHGFRGKYLVRRLMAGVLPEPVLRRRKMGFAVPVADWLRHELHDLARDILLGARARQRGYFRPLAVERLLDEHAAAQRDHHTILWSLLMLELWHRTFLDDKCSTH